MKLGTKEKILEQSLEKIRLETMEFLAKKMTKVVSEFLFNYILTIYKHAFNCKNSKELNDALKKFEEAKQQYAGILYNHFEYEVGDLSENLAEYVNSSEATWKPAPFHLYDTPSVSDIVKEIVYSIISPEYSETPEELAIRLHIPAEIVSQASRILPRSNAVTEPKLYDFSGTNNFYSLAPQQQTFGQFPVGRQGIGYPTSGATSITRMALGPIYAQSRKGQQQPLPIGTSISYINKENKPKTLVLTEFTK